MSKATNHETAAGEPDPVDDRLARLLDSSFLAGVVPHLPPDTLHRLIRHRGLEACGALVTSATHAQLASLLDIDLWRHLQPGRDEQFDVERFGEWLEVLVDAGDSVAARTVAALDPYLVTLGLSRYLRVFDPGTFEPTESSDDESRDRHEMMDSERSDDILECEVGGYLVRARRTDAWDAIVTLLVALETEQHRFFHAVMQGCRRLSNAGSESDGLDDLLSAPEQHLHDVATERERRRSRQGYTTPADARAFLQMARQPASPPRTASSPTAPIAMNPIATAYFRAADEEEYPLPPGTVAGPPEGPRRRGATDASTRDEDDITTSIDAVVELLAEAGVAPAPPRALLEATDDDPRAARFPLLRPLTEFVRHHHETAYLARSRELAFLANTLLAGSSVQARPFTRREAADAAAGICNLGLECWPPSPSAGESGASSPRVPGMARPPDDFLVDHDLVAVFGVGWSVLYTDVSLFVADRLIATLADLHGADADTRRGIRALRRTLVREREAGTPWLAREAVDVLATLDLTAWISVLGLLDECPILPAALTAVLERRATSVSASAFEFISTTGQIGEIRLFMRTLPDVLAPPRTTRSRRSFD